MQAHLTAEGTESWEPEPVQVTQLGGAEAGKPWLCGCNRARPHLPPEAASPHSCAFQGALERDREREVGCLWGVGRKLCVFRRHWVPVFLCSRTDFRSSWGFGLARVGQGQSPSPQSRGPMASSPGVAWGLCLQGEEPSGEEGRRGGGQLPGGEEPPELPPWGRVTAGVCPLERQG